MFLRSFLGFCTQNWSKFLLKVTLSAWNTSLTNTQLISSYMVRKMCQCSPKMKSENDLFWHFICIITYIIIQKWWHSHRKYTKRYQKNKSIPVICKYITLYEYDYSIIRQKKTDINSHDWHEVWVVCNVSSTSCIHTKRTYV